jgi:hypothetical protein
MTALIQPTGNIRTALDIALAGRSRPNTTQTSGSPEAFIPALEWWQEKFLPFWIHQEQKRAKLRIVPSRGVHCEKIVHRALNHLNDVSEERIDRTGQDASIAAYAARVHLNGAYFGRHHIKGQHVAILFAYRTGPETFQLAVWEPQQFTTKDKLQHENIETFCLGADFSDVVF